MSTLLHDALLGETVTSIDRIYDERPCGLDETDGALGGAIEPLIR